MSNLLGSKYVARFCESTIILTDGRFNLLKNGNANRCELCKNGNSCQVCLDMRGVLGIKRLVSGR